MITNIARAWKLTPAWVLSLVAVGSVAATCSSGCCGPAATMAADALAGRANQGPMSWGGVVG